MIITRTPYRLSFFGGGTDFPEYYEEHGGTVLSSSINRYSYLHCRVLPPFFDHKYRIRYFQTERVGSVEEIKHPSVRECLRFLNFAEPIEVLHSGDIPAMSGIGSSSAFTVGLLLALTGLMGRMVTKRELAQWAITVERGRIGENVGCQDQYAAAFGGLNRIDFGPGSQIRLTPLILDQSRLRYLQDNLLFCYNGQSRLSSDIQLEHRNGIKNKLGELKELKQLADEAQGLLGGPERDIDEFGRLLGLGWKLKKNLSPRVTDPGLDNLYETAIRAGALGGKLCGAGGGGFFVFYVTPDKRETVKKALEPALIVPISFEYLGSQTIYYAHYG